MSSMYSFNKNSFHVKFFQWMWGIDPTRQFKTMCPYFWQYVGSIIILPFILLWKAYKAISTPIYTSIVNQKTESNRLAKEQFKLDLMKLKEDGATDKEIWVFTKKKCFDTYFIQLYQQLRTPKDGASEEEMERAYSLIGFYNRVYDINHDGIPKEEGEYTKTQKVKDKLLYGIVGKILGSIVIAGIVALIGWGLYAFVHTFTMEQFLHTMKAILIVAVFFGLCYGIVKLFILIFSNIPCKDDGIIGNIMYKMGQGIHYVWKGIKYMFTVTFDMIASFYKNQCPVITWEDDKSNDL